MAVIESYPHGMFCWPELATSDAAAAKEFYKAIFGWEAHDFPVGEDRFYTMLKIGEHDVGALQQLPAEKAKLGVPPHWLIFVSVENVDDVAARAAELGGKLAAGPFDVFDAGRMAVLEDPQGAAFALWQAREHIGATVGGADNSLCWSELSTTDLGAAREFYSKLLGWTYKEAQDPKMEYPHIQVGGRDVGGMMILPEPLKSQGVPPYWLNYYSVSDCDAVANKAKEHGGVWHVPPTDIPNTGRFSVIGDPQGAVFAIVKLDLVK